ncbi:MAG: DinB family protein [Gemmatimonadetes bacterium]|nr:DinB family protein [Gemmatimonadota bacterium]NNK62960.1 hypothetical protein [Gemmatimonadota bacterium]
MSLSAHLIAQLDAELDASKRVIERIPESMYAWQPHDKSFKALDLATHVANLISWGAMILTTEDLDFASEEMQNWKPPTADTAGEVLQLLEQNGAQVRGILGSMSDEDLETSWTMRMGEQIYSSDPRHFAFARWVLAHQAHHRGQLTVYLRLRDVPVPGIFGPSADETEM